MGQLKYEEITENKPVVLNLEYKWYFRSERSTDNTPMRKYRCRAQHSDYNIKKLANRAGITLYCAEHGLHWRHYHLARFFILHFHTFLYASGRPARESEEAISAG